MDNYTINADLPVVAAWAQIETDYIKHSDIFNAVDKHSADLDDDWRVHRYVGRK